MELKHYINNREIDEPIGFDSLKMVMKRGEYHGMSAEVSEQTLEFYGKAADMIRDAYNTDIDTELRYIVMADGTEVYNGVIDLSTYEEQRSQYYSVSCKVGEVGVKTTFNNRTKTEIDLNTNKTIDGEDCSFVPIWKNLTIPKKSLLYTNSGEWKDGDVIFNYEDTKDDYSYNDIFIIPTKVSVNEFGDMPSDDYIFDAGSDFAEKYGNSVIDFSFYMEIYGEDVTYISERIDNQYISAYCKIYADLLWSGGTKIKTLLDGAVIKTGEVITFGTTDKMKGTDSYLKLHIAIKRYRSNYNGNVKANITVKKGNIKMTMWDNLQTDTNKTNMILVYDMLNTLCSKISENQLRLASDWYGFAEMSGIGVTAKGFGGGALKAITNGYKIRGLFEDENGEKRSMPISFEKAIKSLDMLDCIGWGFSEENGLMRVRVERWNWFYKDNVLMRLTSPNEIRREIDTDKYFNEFAIGYKKYETSDNYNSIDTYHGERTFVSVMKSIANAKEVSCEFIADNYAIEETRRARFQVDETEEFKYDENLFVFELSARTAAITNVIIDYSVVNNLTSSEGVQRPTEQINVQLSPRRCAERWNSFLHRLNNRRSFTFSVGKNNCDAVLKCNVTSGSAMQARTNYLQDFAEGEPMKENQEMTYVAPLFKAETLSFKYPLTISQYKAIKANPYGLVEVDGIQGWIKEFSYTFNTGEAEFKLIPKA